jgi:hypothetical protein
MDFLKIELSLQIKIVGGFYEYFISLVAYISGTANRLVNPLFLQLVVFSSSAVCSFILFRRVIKALFLTLKKPDIIHVFMYNSPFPLPSSIAISSLPSIWILLIILDPLFLIELKNVTISCCKTQNFCAILNPACVGGRYLTLPDLVLLQLNNP